MRLAFVVSDLSYPPTEGLHQHTISLIGNLMAAGWTIDLYGFAKSDSALDTESLLAAEGIRFVSPPVVYRGSSLLEALRLRVTRRDIRHALRTRIDQGRYSATHLEGVVAAALFSRQDDRPTLISMVDPGSRRNIRMARTARQPLRKVAHLVASLIFAVLERSVRVPQCAWHVVSTSDARYLERVHGHDSVCAIPIYLPPEIEHHDGLSTLVRDCSLLEDQPRRITVLVYADLRQAFIREALLDTMEVIRACESARHARFRVLGRTDLDGPLAIAFAGLDAVALPWVDDYFAEILAADLVLLPDTVGTGLKTRAVQSLRAGVPVLGRPAAFEGIQVEDGVNAAIATGPTDLAARFELLCTDTEVRERMGRAAGELALRQFSSASITEQWRQCYAALTADVG